MLSPGRSLDFSVGSFLLSRFAEEVPGKASENSDEGYAADNAADDGSEWGSFGGCGVGAG